MDVLSTIWGYMTSGISALHPVILAAVLFAIFFLLLNLKSALVYTPIIMIIVLGYRYMTQKKEDDK